MSALLEGLAVLAELTGTTWSKPTVRVIERELQAYPDADVLLAVRRCQVELRGRVTLADILDRLPCQHPGVEQAWAAISKIMQNEALSLCWTDQMREAYGVASPLAGDLVAARMAFKESYIRLVAEARARRELPRWSVSLGHDASLRDECVREAAAKNLITKTHAEKLLTYDIPTDEATKILLEYHVTL